MTQWLWNTPSMMLSLRATMLRSNCGFSRIAVWFQAGTPSTWSAGSTTTTPARYHGCFHAHSSRHYSVNEPEPIHFCCLLSFMGGWQEFSPRKAGGKNRFIYSVVISSGVLNLLDDKRRELPLRNTQEKSEHLLLYYYLLFRIPIKCVQHYLLLKIVSAT